MTRIALLALGVLVALVAIGRGHGGLPVSQQLMFDGDRVALAVKYWGLFLGREGGPWEWVCDEAISPDLVTANPSRVWARTSRGTYHLTDFKGVVSSRDGGCTWTPADGEIALRPTSVVVADPAAAREAWAVSYSSEAPWNAVFRTADDGVTWTALFQADVNFNGLAISADGTTLYATGQERAGGQRLVVYVSQDRGQSFQPVYPSYTLDGQVPRELRVLAVDPADPQVAWLTAFKDPKYALVKATGHATQTVEQFQSPGAIEQVAFDGARQTTWAATQGGLIRQAAGGAWERASHLATAQCVDVRGSSIFACSTSYAPDFLVIARSDDGGQSFRSIYRYDETAGPLTGCPPDTPVARICPGLWDLYAERLGVPVARVDGGGDGASPPPGPGGCSFAISR